LEPLTAYFIMNGLSGKVQSVRAGL
jgi:hypothetical protein